MLAKTKIALCVAVAVGIAVFSMTCAFAKNEYDSPDWAPPCTGGTLIGPQRLALTKAMPTQPLRGGAGSVTRPGSRTRSEGVTDKTEGDRWRVESTPRHLPCVRATDSGADFPPRIIHSSRRNVFQLGWGINLHVRRSAIK